MNAKKILFGLLSILCLTFTVTSISSCEKESYTEGLNYKLLDDGSGYVVTGIGAATDTNIVIPSIINDKPVTSIDEYAFYECSSLTRVVIPDSVTSIGSVAFFNCSSLTSIKIGNSVTSIGYSAFSYCSSLESIVVDSNNKYYDSRNNCNAIIETSTDTLIAGCKNTTIPNSVTSIGENAFWHCKSLTSITIPDSVASIGRAAFASCSSLTSITIPDTITIISELAFGYCDSLTTVYYTGTEEQWNNIYGNDDLTTATIYYNYKG